MLLANRVGGSFGGSFGTGALWELWDTHKAHAPSNTYAADR